jgi:hypothetical protein
VLMGKRLASEILDFINGNCDDSRVGFILKCLIVLSIC